MFKNIKLGDVGIIIIGQSPKRSNLNNEEKGMPFYQGKKDYGDKFLKPPTVWTKHVTKVALEGDLLMSIRASVGALNFATQEICIGRGLAAIRVNTDIDKSYLFYVLTKICNQLIVSSGVIFNSINKKQIENIEFVLPPLLEQQRIVAKLDAVFSEISRLIKFNSNKIKNLRLLRNTIFEQIINNKTSKLTFRLQELVDKDCSLCYGIVKPGNHYKDGIPLIRPIDIKGKFINSKILKLIKPSIALNYKRTKLEGDEILMTVRGITGSLSFSSIELKGANVTRGIIPIRFNSKMVESEFGYYALLSRNVQTEIQLRTYGTTLQQINVRDVKNLRIDIPSLEEQRKAIPKLIKAEKKLSIIELNTKNNLNNLRLLRFRILKDLLA